MPRLPYLLPKPGESAIADAIRLRRKSDLTELDGILMNAPQIAEALNGVGQAIRIDSSLPADVRELVILRVAVLNGAAYEWRQHVDVGSRAGLSTSHLAVIRDASTVMSDDVDPAGVLTEMQKAALVYADWMTKNIQVPDRVFGAIRAVLDDRQVTELTSTVACYNMVSRFLVALDVGGMAASSIPEVTGL